MNRLLLLALLPLLTGCAAASTAAPVVEPPAHDAVAGNPTPWLTVDVKAPRPVPFTSTALGLDEALVAVRIANRGSRPVRVGPVRIAFQVRRDGVRFECPASRESDDAEAATLPPGAELTAYAPLRCWTPIPGAYDALAVVALGNGESARLIPFRFDVDDPTQVAARPYPSRPGLYVVAGGAPRTSPVPDLTADDRSYHAVLVLANASVRALALPPARVTLNVFRAGDSLPCSTQVALLPFAPIAPGGTHVERVPVTCLRDRRGPYEIRVLVGFEDEPSVEAGRFHVRVTDDLGVIISIP